MSAARGGRLYARRRLVNVAVLTLSSGAVLFGLAWLFALLVTLVTRGAGGLGTAVFTQMTPPPGSAGGLANAIVGSLVMTAVATAAGTAIGILAGVYLSEFGHGTRLANATRFVADILLSAPSILIGLFVYSALVVPMRHFSGWAGAAALALIVIPIVVRTTEDMLRLVPPELREAASALGAPRYRVVATIVLRAARAGVVTGVLLAVARVSGETAPLLFTALNNQFWSLDMDRPLANLPVTIFQFAMSPYDDWHRLAWAGALLITVAVLGLSVLARAALRRRPVQ